MNYGSDYVFLSSTKMEELADEMDVNGQKKCLQDEPAYFDGTFNRVYGFVNFGLWLFHPTLRKLLCLANMEMHSEKTENVSVLFYIIQLNFGKTLTGRKG